MWIVVHRRECGRWAQYRAREGLVKLSIFVSRPEMWLSEAGDVVGLEDVKASPKGKYRTRFARVFIRNLFITIHRSPNRFPDL